MFVVYPSKADVYNQKSADDLYMGVLVSCTCLYSKWRPVFLCMPVVFKDFCCLLGHLCTIIQIHCSHSMRMCPPGFLHMCKLVNECVLSFSRVRSSGHGSLISENTDNRDWKVIKLFFSTQRLLPLFIYTSCPVFVKEAESVCMYSFRLDNLKGNISEAGQDIEHLLNPDHHRSTIQLIIIN